MAIEEDSKKFTRLEPKHHEKKFYSCRYGDGIPGLQQ